MRTLVNRQGKGGRDKRVDAAATMQLAVAVPAGMATNVFLGVVVAVVAGVAGVAGVVACVAGVVADVVAGWRSTLVTGVMDDTGAGEMVVDAVAGMASSFCGAGVSLSWEDGGAGGPKSAPH